MILQATYQNLQITRELSAKQASHSSEKQRKIISGVV